MYYIAWETNKRPLKGQVPDIENMDFSSYHNYLI